MRLPENFSFSQQNLQDYADCRYRFLLKYVRRIEWPAVESEPVLLQEARMELGQQFHRMVQQYFSGVDPSLLALSVQSPELAACWHEFMALDLQHIPGVKVPEKTISILFVGYRLTAKFDLLVVTPEGNYSIFDWKTSGVLPKANHLLSRLQSIVYPYVLQTWISRTTKDDNPPSEIEMIYWYPSHPTLPFSFNYSVDHYSRDENHLSGLVNEIINREEEGFDRTPEQSKCRFCRYRSLCGRGISAAIFESGSDEPIDGSAFDLDFDAL